MNLPTFLNEVDAHTASMTHEELTAFIHEIARTLPAEQREEFLSKLTEISEIIQEDETDSDEPKTLLEQLDKICSGEFRLDSQLNEEYDDWYDSEETEFDFEDGDGLLDIINTACTELHQMIDKANYTEAYLLGQKLITLKVQTDGDYTDYLDSGMNLYDLEIYDLIKTPVETVLLDVLCACYFTLSPEEKPSMMYQIGKSFRRVKWTLEELVQSASTELPEMEGFLTNWIEFLGSVPEQSAEELLLEAITMQNQPVQALETARKFSAIHPVLYEKALAMQADDESRLKIGLEALQKLDTWYFIRSNIALQTAETAIRLGMPKEAEYCRLEAFRSETTPLNYLRALLNSSNFEACQNELYEILKHLLDTYTKEEFRLDRPKSQAKNFITDETNRLIKFLNGKFLKAYGNLQSQINGYHSDILEQGTALTALFLYPSDTLQEGAKAMCSYLVKSLPFDAKKYNQGVEDFSEKDSVTLLWQCLKKCREHLPLTNPENALDNLQKLCVTATEYVMQNDMRKQYEDCAVLAAVIGEIQEMNSHFNKNDFLLECKAKYPRRIAYHRELRKYGMKDGK